MTGDWTNRQTAEDFSLDPMDRRLKRQTDALLDLKIAFYWGGRD